MCLYERNIKNPKYLPNKKNNGKPATPKDKRAKIVTIKCGVCKECRQQKVNEWLTRLNEEFKKNVKKIFVTLTFTNEALNRLPNEPNEAAKRAVRLWMYRIKKSKGKTIKYFLRTELGDENTERLHMHGAIWHEEESLLKKAIELWQYGIIDIGDVNEKSLKYTVKYIWKPDEKHPEFKGITIASKKIGSEWCESEDAKKIQRRTDLQEYIKDAKGYRHGIPNYWRGKIFDDDEREKRMLINREKQTKFIDGEKFIIKNNKEKEIYQKTLEFRRITMEKMGFQKPKPRKQFGDIDSNYEF